MNTLHDGNSKYREVIYEYYWDSDSRWNGNYKSEYHRTIGADGSESWYRYDHSYDNYAAPFGENAYSHVRIDTYSEGVTQTYEWAYTYYKGYQFTLYEYYTGDSSWWKNDFIYRFADGCERTRTYTSSDGSTQTYTEEAHPSWYYETVLSPTCTQYGLTAHRCPAFASWTDASMACRSSARGLHPPRDSAKRCTPARPLAPAHGTTHRDVHAVLPQEFCFASRDSK